MTAKAAGQGPLSQSGGGAGDRYLLPAGDSGSAGASGSGLKNKIPSPDDVFPPKDDNMESIVSYDNNELIPSGQEQQLKQFEESGQESGLAQMTASISPEGDGKVTPAGINDAEKPTEELKRCEMGHPREELDKVKWVFRILLFSQMLVNYDSGAIPRVLKDLQKDFGVDDAALAVLGGVPYVGITCSAGFSGYLLQTYSQKTVLIGALVLNACSCLLMSIAWEWWQLVLARCLIGVTQAPFVIYSTVWVEEYAPLKNKTTWVGLLQIGKSLRIRTRPQASTCSE